MNNDFSVLQTKMHEASAWMERVNNAIGRQSLSGCDLVCLQCELEELTQIIIQHREALKDARNAQEVAQ